MIFLILLKSKRLVFIRHGMNEKSLNGLAFTNLLLLILILLYSLIFFSSLVNL